VAATPIRAIAAAAEVSPGLVIHHFGSKDALRVACDQHVAALVRAAKTEAFEAGTSLDPIAAFREASDDPPLLGYLARTLVDGSPQVAELVDEMVEDAVAYLAIGEERGTVTPSEDPKGRAVVLTLWSLGSLVLREHVARLTGADPTDPLAATAWTMPAMEILAKGVISEELYDHYRAAFTTAQEDAT
jgi:AcrR family transcriptional regulator